MKPSKDITRFENNREEIATVIYEELLKLATDFQFGTIGVNIHFHNGIIDKVEFTETRKSRITAGSN